ncbi:MAG: hypothetical protein CML12_02175 [Puniceicoccaceae bacterium]|nr:hypothetical protein [Puniceicoccaceae bacterium]
MIFLHGYKLSWNKFIIEVSNFFYINLTSFMNLNKLFFFILIPLFFIGFFVLITISGPKTIDSDEFMKKPSFEIPEEYEALRLKSLSMEGQFEEILSLREYNLSDLDLLLEAIELQELYVSALPYHGFQAHQRLDFLKQRYDQLASEIYHAQSILDERLSQEYSEQGEHAKAIEKIQSAIEGQTTINELYGLSTHRDMNRITQLKRTLNYYNAYPLYAEIQELERKVMEFVKSEEWIAAAEVMQQIIKKQLFLNSEYRSSKLASSSKVNDYKLREVTYLSEPLRQDINSFTAKADALVQKQDYKSAAAFYQEALRLQIELNKNFLESPYNSNDQVNDLLVKSQTAGSYDLGESINNLNFEIDRDLRLRNLGLAKEKIIRIADAILRIKEEFPKSAYNDRDLEIKIKFLNYIRNDLLRIQDRVYENLLPIPDEPSKQIYKSEVSQAFYDMIMGVNPSRYQDDLKPVESVSWEDARNFCKRLSWILGLTVRLPKEYEFRAMVGRLRYVKLEKHVVSNLDGDGLADIQSKEALALGAHDLLGNVSEWLYSEEANYGDFAKHIGGHFGDSLEAIYTVPLRQANRNERSRLIGFRFVVE